jgi:hypothetical protein
MDNNVNITVQGKKLIIEVDLTKDLGVSKSGKSHIIATTNGFTQVTGEQGVAVNLNVIKK